MYLQWSEKTIERLEKEGRGKGTGASYKPWVAHTHDSSIGKMKSVKGIKIPRTHLFLSHIEYQFFLCAERSPEVVDIQEQYPLPREFTRHVADKLKIKHPYYKGTQVPAVMTVDFLLTMRRSDGESYHRAVTIKTDADVEDRRTIDKLEIERACLAELNIHQYHLVTESSIPQAVSWNLDLIRAKLPRDLELPETIELLTTLKAPMASWIHSFNDKDREKSAHMHCALFDQEYGQPAGTGLRVLAMLFHERTFPVNLSVKSLFDTPWKLCVGEAEKLDDIMGRRAA